MLSVAQLKTLITDNPAALDLAALACDERKSVQRLLAAYRRRCQAEQAERRRWQQFRRHERAGWEEGCRQVAGLDEVGRGPLAGPVIAAAVVLRPDFYLPGMRESKQLSPKQRREFAARIRASAAWAVGEASVEEIDTLNILRASLLAMDRARRKLPEPPDLLLIDGKFILSSRDTPQRAIVAGDAQSACIAAASIIAKTYRDDLMARLDREYPGYGFADHFGYPTPQHRAILRSRGPCPIHRKTFLRFLDRPTGLFELPPKQKEKEERSDG